MSDVPPLIITTAGLAAAVNNAGGVQITHIALGSGINGTTGYEPTGAATALKTQIAYQEINDADVVGTQQVVATAFSGDHELVVREIGLYLNDGTLFAISASEPDKLLAYKAEGSANVYVAKASINLAQLPVDSINVVIGAQNLNLIIDNELAVLSTAIIKNAMGQLNIAKRIYEITGEYV